MTKTFRQLLSESTAPKKVATNKTTATPKKNTKPVAPKATEKPKAKPATLKESSALTLADLGFTPPKAKLDEAAWLMPAPAPTYVDRSESKYDDSIFDLDASDIGLVFESFEDEDEEPRDEQNSVDTAESGDDVPPVGAASMANKSPAAEEGGEEEAAPAAKGPTFKEVTLTVPALQHLLKVISHKSPDKVTINSIVMSMAHHGATVDVGDFEAIKHAMHGMEAPAGGDAVDGGEEAQEGPGPNPSIYATDDVIDDAGEAPEGGEEGDEGEDKGGAPEASQKDAQDKTDDGEKTDDGKTQLDDEEDEESEEKDDKPCDDDKPCGDDKKPPVDKAKDDKEEAEDKQKDENEDCGDMDDDLEESMSFDIESVFESVSDDDVRMIRRRSGLKYWD